MNERRKYRLRRVVIGFGFVLWLGLTSMMSPTARAIECVSNEQVRRTEAYGERLPDCRAYEQVSPANKNVTDALGAPGAVESSPTGDAVSYFSLTPFPGIPGAGEYPTYISVRNQNGWALHGLVPPTEPGVPANVVGISESLGSAIVSVGTPTQPSYIYTLQNKQYQPFSGGSEVKFVGSAQNDSLFLFEDQAKLAKNAGDFTENSGATNLYEWKEGQIDLVGLLPDGEAPKEGSVAGSGGKAIEEKEEGEVKGELPGGATSVSKFYTQNTLSVDGSRAFFTDVETGRIYVRELGERESTIPVSEGQAYWRAATPTGSHVLYTEGKGKSRNLYLFDVENNHREALTQGEAHVLGTLGISEDGSYIYFVAEGVLASHGVAESANLYEWHEGITTFIASLNIEADDFDWTDRQQSAGGPAEGGKSSRVTPSGTSVLFGSIEELTSYKNKGHYELYLYDALSGRTVCISCNPSARPAGASAFLTRHKTAAPFRNTFMTQNLSNDGSRAFFETEEELLPEDTNGQMDVYEWEREGSGSCSKEASNVGGGCLYLISTGHSTAESYFGDASAEGNDVFLFTRGPLVSQDQDNNADIYDARVDGGLAAQNPDSVAPCASEICRGSAVPTQIFAVPSSALFNGVGNLVTGRNGNGVKRLKSKAQTVRKKRHNKIKAKRRRHGSYGKRAQKSANRAARR